MQVGSTHPHGLPHGHGAILWIVVGGLSLAVAAIVAGLVVWAGDRGGGPSGEAPAAITATASPTESPSPPVSPTASAATPTPTVTATPTVTPTPPTATPTPRPPLGPSNLYWGSPAIAANLGGDILRVRAGPGTEYPQIAALRTGEGVMLMSSRTSDQAGAYFWWRVQLNDGTIGWAAEGPVDGSQRWLVSPYLQPGNLAVSANLGGDELRVRSGPGVEYPQIGRLLEGDEVILVSPRSTDRTRTYLWWRVRLADGTLGWAAEGPVDGSLKWLVPAGTIP